MLPFVLRNQHLIVLYQIYVNSSGVYSQCTVSKPLSKTMSLRSIPQFFIIHDEKGVI